MLKPLFAALAALSLAGCAPLLGALTSVALPPPAPLAQTVVDERALNLAWEAYDTVLTTVDGLVEAGVLVRNTPRALQVRSALIQVRTGLNAATAAARAGNAATYAEALASATQAYSQVRSLLSGDAS